MALKTKTDLTDLQVCPGLCDNLRPLPVTKQEKQGQRGREGGRKEEGEGMALEV